MSCRRTTSHAGSSAKQLYSQKESSGRFIVQQMLLNMVELHCNRKVLGTMKPDKQSLSGFIKKECESVFYYA
jgi:hypothetical protein